MKLFCNLYYNFWSVYDDVLYVTFTLNFALGWWRLRRRGRWRQQFGGWGKDELSFRFIWILVNLWINKLTQLYFVFHIGIPWPFASPRPYPVVWHSGRRRQRGGRQRGGRQRRRRQQRQRGKTLMLHTLLSMYYVRIPKIVIVFIT